MINLTEEQIKRYSRHILIPEIGGKGQRKLLESRILIIGAGGLGSPAAFYLAGAGIGEIGIVDGDDVELSNLQRQILHTTEDIGIPKVLSAKKRLAALNPEVRITPYHVRLNKNNISEIIKEYDLIIDGSDNFPTKFLVNDASFFEKKPVIISGILRFDGQLIAIKPGESACYRCIFPSPPPPGLIPSCQEAGVLGVVAGIMGAIEALQAIKLILNIGNKMTDRLIVFNALKMEFRDINISRNPGCPLCGINPKITGLIDYNEICQQEGV